MNLHIFSTHEALSTAVAEHVAAIAAEAASARQQFTVAISGGSLPKLLCPDLIAEPLRSQIDWSVWHIFWADERCVPLDHPDSNYRLAKEALFDHVTIPASQIYPIDPALAPADAALAYESELGKLWPRKAQDLPRFDLILLGMGEDGHTASLFPGHPLLSETERWVAPIFDSPKPPPERITLTLPVLNNARYVSFISTGSGKAEILPEAVESKIVPAGKVQPAQGRLDWFVDEAAASKVKRRSG